MTKRTMAIFQKISIVLPLLALPAPASAQVYAGSGCTYNGLPSSNAFLKPSPGTAILHNNSSNNQEAICSIKGEGKQHIFFWDVIVDTSAAWSRTSCDVYWTNNNGNTVWLSPSPNLFPPVSGVRQLGSNGIADLPPKAIIVLLCTMPPNSTIYNFDIYQDDTLPPV